MSDYIDYAKLAARSRVPAEKDRYERMAASGAKVLTLAAIERRRAEEREANRVR